ncbi:MAG: hypothetical protein ACRDJ9_21575 [Dehalococcoidia bacterium]
MSRRVRITAKRRREIDVDKLVTALLRIIESERQVTAEKPSAQPTEAGRAPGTESAA